MDLRPDWQMSVRLGQTYAWLFVVVPFVYSFYCLLLSHERDGEALLA
jgi:hypothetical protein